MNNEREQEEGSSYSLGTLKEPLCAAQEDFKKIKFAQKTFNSIQWCDLRKKRKDERKKKKQTEQLP